MNTLAAALLSYLLNSIWQVPLLFVAAHFAVKLIARIARRSNPVFEHRIWISALILEILLPACPAFPPALLDRHPLQAVLTFVAGLWHHSVAPAAAQVSVSTTVTSATTAIRLPAPLLMAIAALYFGVLVYSIGRLIHSLLKTNQLRRTASPIRLTAETLCVWRRFSIIFQVKDALLASSSRVFAPSTIGIRDRLILLPNIMPSSLHQDDLNAALAHEFAHLRRRDFALNLLYQVLALPIAWHPALWLTSARIAETREMICDFLAARALAGPELYAHSLLRLASQLLCGAPSPTPHAIGIFDANIFERRLMNLTTKPVELRGIRRFVPVVLSAAVGFAACSSALALHTNILIPVHQTAETPATPHIAGGVIAGNRLSFTNPVYPPDAKAAKLSGTVILHAIIGKDGTIENLSVISGPEAFQKSALDAVHQWTYKPYLLNGEPTTVDTTITVNYSISKGSK